jgi:iron-sulfur cluster assembly protein
MFDDLEPISISPKAAAEIRKIMQTKNIPEGYGLRVGIRGGSGCGGATFILGFDTKKEGDIFYTKSEIPVFVDKKHTLYLIGKEVDFIDSADARGFTFIDADKKV